MRVGDWRQFPFCDRVGGCGRVPGVRHFATPRGLPVRGAVDYQSAARSCVVPQTGSLLYRRMAFGGGGAGAGSMDWRTAGFGGYLHHAVARTASPRHSRLTTGGTGMRRTADWQSAVSPNAAQAGQGREPLIGGWRGLRALASPSGADCQSAARPITNRRYERERSTRPACQDATTSQNCSHA
jgi:hypothetical protein